MHWGQVMHIIYASMNYVNFGSDKALLPKWRQAITLTNADILLTGPLRTNFSEIFIEIQTVSLQKMHLKI